MMKQLLLAASLALIAGQSHALSCMRPDPIRTFQRLSEAPESYLVIYGQLSFDEAALPGGGSKDPPREPAPIAAQFRGKSLSQAGFTNDYVGDVIVQIGCLGPWCGLVHSGVDAVYFVAASEPAVTLWAPPCGGRIFEEPTETTLDMLTSCMQGGACTPQPFE